MSKLVCETHHARVHVFPSTVVHRHNGSTCDTNRVMINRVSIPVDMVRKYADQDRSIHMAGWYLTK